MGRNLHCSIIVGTISTSRGYGILEEAKCTSELVAKITEAHSVGKTQAQGIVDSMLKSLASARNRNPDGSLR
jgi:hypothetical protein